MVKIFYILNACVQLAVIGCSFRGLCSIVTIYTFDLCTKEKSPWRTTVQNPFRLC